MDGGPCGRRTAPPATRKLVQKLFFGFSAHSSIVFLLFSGVGFSAAENEPIKKGNSFSTIGAEAVCPQAARGVSEHHGNGDGEGAAGRLSSFRWRRSTLPSTLRSPDASPRRSSGSPCTSTKCRANRCPANSRPFSNSESAIGEFSIPWTSRKRSSRCMPSDIGVRFTAHSQSRTSPG